MSSRRGPLIAVCSALAVAAFAPAAQSSDATPTAVAAATPCSSEGLSYERSDGYTNETTKVRRLRVAGGAKCREARDVARVVAKRIHNDQEVPSKVKGYRIKTRREGSVTYVKGTRGKNARLAFEVVQSD